MTRGGETLRAARADRQTAAGRKSEAERESGQKLESVARVVPGEGPPCRERRWGPIRRRRTMRKRERVARGEASRQLRGGRFVRQAKRGRCLARRDPGPDCPRDCPIPGASNRVELRDFEIEEERDPRIMPAGMRRPAGRIGRGAEFDGMSGVGPAREVEPVAETDGVIDEPEDRGGGDGDRGKPECRCSEACALAGSRAAKQRECRRRTMR